MKRMSEIDWWEKSIRRFYSLVKISVRKYISNIPVAKAETIIKYICVYWVQIVTKVLFNVINDTS